MRWTQNLMAVVGLASVGSLLLAQPNPGGGQNCIKDIQPVPGACTVGASAIQNDPNCTQQPVIVESELCPSVVQHQLEGFSEAFPQGFAGCTYRYYQYVDGECVLSSLQNFSWPCKAAGGASCAPGGGTH